MSKPRTIEDVLANWEAMANGTTQYEGRQPRDWELALAEIKRLREIVAKCSPGKKRAPVVLVEVYGGVASWLKRGKVDVALLDWDNVKGGDVCELGQRHRDLLSDESLAELDRLNKANAGHEP